MAEKNYLIFSSRIKEAYGSLAKKERRIADFLLQNPEFVLNATAKEIAEATDSSAATVIRFCRTCGFNGLTELKLSLKRESKLVDPHPTRAVDAELGNNDLSGLVQQRVLGYHNLVVDALLSDWNLSAYSMAAEAMLRAKRIIIVGEGGSRASCFCLMNMLLTMGFRCEHYMDSMFEIVNIDSLHSDDVVIDISYSGMLRTSVDSMKLAKERGATTIGLIGLRECPILEHIDIVLNTTSPKQDYYDSEMSVRIAELVVIDILISLLSVKYRHLFGETKLESPACVIRRITK